MYGSASAPPQQCTYRGVGSLEGLTWDTASEQLREGDALSPNWRPRRGTDGTPNESSQDVLIRVRQVSVIHSERRRHSPDRDAAHALVALLLPG